MGRLHLELKLLRKCPSWDK